MPVPEGFEVVTTPIPSGFEVVKPVDDEQGLFRDIDSAFSKIPGAPALSEFAAAFNRPVLETIDFLGPDNINAILEISGSERRVPTLTGKIGSEGGFMEPGTARDATRAAGSTASQALGIGQLLRSAAAKLPSALSGASIGAESTGAGLLRQAGATTAATDVGIGAAAGAGAETGREVGESVGGPVGGEIGALAGSIAAPVALSIPLSSAKSQAVKLLKKAAPTIDELKVTARGIYNSLDESGVIVSKKSFDGLVRDISATLRKEGLDPDLTPKASAVLRRLRSETGAEKTLTEIDTLRKVVRSAAESVEASDRRLGNIAINKIDDYLDGIGSEIGGGRQAGEAFKSARNLWQRAKKAEVLDTAVIDATSQASGLENGIRTQFRSLLKRINNGKLKGFSEEERKAIERTVNGTRAGNIARFLGKFGVLDGVTSRSLTTLGGAGLAGAMTGSTGVAAAVPLVGQVSGSLSQRMTENNARMANAVIRAGKNGTAITSAYIKNTPKAQRSAIELAELLLKNDVAVNAISTKNTPEILSTAAIYASIALNNDEKSEDE